MNLAKNTEAIKRFFEKIINLFRGSFKILFQKKPKLQKIQKDIVSGKISESRKPKQITIERSKFSSWSSSVQEHKPITQELPSAYNEDKIVLQIRDPWWIHCYWEMTTQTKVKLKESFGDQYNQVNWILRVYDVSFIIFNGDNAHRYFDISINSQADNWYINVSSGSSFCVDLGLKLKDGRFILVSRSNTVTTPLDKPSGIIDEEWLISDEEFLKLYGFGLGGTSPMGKRRRIGEYISSSGFISAAKVKK
ncbi:MAG: DUF4912 domain-containing protein [Candidatus Omnitrophica bacterium]|nr:DUF4912 domain-containing protein [Candidatus Omnitrophota bacterium]